jgi:hypothetical protein
MNDSTITGADFVATFVVSLILTWGIGLAPPLVTRFVILKRPLGRGGAIGFAAVFFISNIALFTAMGSKNKTHTALTLVALATYFILTYGAKPHPPKRM